MKSDAYVHVRTYSCVSAPLGAPATGGYQGNGCVGLISLQLVERLRKRRLGSGPVRGEFASVLPWQGSGLGLWWWGGWMDGGEVDVLVERCADKAEGQSFKTFNCV